MANDYKIIQSVEISSKEILSKIKFNHMIIQYQNNY